MSCTSKWRMPIVRLPTSRTTANVSGSRSSSDVAVAGLLAQAVHPLAELLVGLELELGLEVPDASDTPLVLAELLGLADVQRTVKKAHARSA